MKTGSLSNQLPVFYLNAFWDMLQGNALQYGNDRFFHDLDAVHRI